MEGPADERFNESPICRVSQSPGRQEEGSLKPSVAAFESRSVMSPEEPFFVIHQGGQRPRGRCSPGRIDRRCIGRPHEGHRTMWLETATSDEACPAVWPSPPSTSEAGGWSAAGQPSCWRRAARGQEAIVAHLNKPLRQRVLQEAADELLHLYHSSSSICIEIRLHAGAIAAGCSDVMGIVSTMDGV